MTSEMFPRPRHGFERGIDVTGTSKRCDKKNSIEA